MTAIGDLRVAAERVTDSVRTGLLDGAGLQIVKAPPGAGKTHLLLELLQAGVDHKMRLAVGTFTNAQADDICRRMANEHPGVDTCRFISHAGAEPHLGTGIQVARTAAQLPTGPCVVVASTAKWALSNYAPFDALLIDEAWQIAWADFLLLRGVAPRFVLIGDPGQIPPVISIPTDRWETAPSAPHIPTPELLLARDDFAAPEELPATRRLPYDTAHLVNEFYDFRFGAFAEPGERSVRLSTRGGRGGIDRALDLLGDNTVVGLTVPTPDDGPPVEIDDEVAREVSVLISRLLERGPTTSFDEKSKKKPVPLLPKEIGIVSTHRTMNTRLHYRLPSGIQREIRVETPERWQGLERKVMIAVHPLSGVLDPTAFELDTGRLCVMASRHRCALILVSRDHVEETLRSHIVSAEQAVGRADHAGLGLDRNLGFWNGLATREVLVPA